MGSGEGLGCLLSSCSSGPVSILLKVPQGLPRPYGSSLNKFTRLQVSSGCPLCVWFSTCMRYYGFLFGFPHSLGVTSSTTYWSEAVSVISVFTTSYPSPCSGDGFLPPSWSHTTLFNLHAYSPVFHLPTLECKCRQAGVSILLKAVIPHDCPGEHALKDEWRGCSSHAVGLSDKDITATGHLPVAS